MDKSIVAKNLTKRFGKFTAVDAINIEVEVGEIFGFLGANGAGKTTTIRMLIGLLRPTSGEISVGGIDVLKYPEKVRKIIGYMSQKFSLYEDLTVEENLNFFGGVYGLSNQDLQRRKKELLELTDMLGWEKYLTKELSTGMKQRLGLAVSIIHKPRIVFLDEPTSGTDPLSRRNFWRIIQNLAQEGICVFVITHFLEEAEYCNKISMIDAGKIIATGSPGTLKRIYSKHPIFEVDFNSLQISLAIQKEGCTLGELSLFGTKLHLFANNEYSVEEVEKYFYEKWEVEKIIVRKIEPTIEDVFINLIMKKHEEFKSN
jgi:ABC-2 type transport system ATP-binding protein